MAALFKDYDVRNIYFARPQNDQERDECRRTNTVAFFVFLMTKVHYNYRKSSTCVSAARGRSCTPSNTSTQSCVTSTRWSCVRCVLLRFVPFTCHYLARSQMHPRATDAIHTAVKYDARANHYKQYSNLEDFRKECPVNA